MQIPLFYLGALLLIAAMVGLALKPGLERQAEWRLVLDRVANEGLVFEGDQLEALIVNERASLTFEGPPEARTALIDGVGVVTEEQNNGAHYLVPPDAARELRGREIELSFDLRTAGVRSSDRFLARVVVANVMDTGWRPLPVGPEWGRAELRFAFPDNGRYEAMDVIVWPDAHGDGGAIEVRRMAITPVGDAGGER